MHHKTPALAATLLLTLSIAACGGGGGGGGGSDPDPAPAPAPTPTPTPPPVETFRLSGSITASPNQAVDSDTNDRSRIAIANDTPFTPQAIGNPVTLGGYINNPGTGAPGRSQIPGDIDDYFLVELLAGQQITMLVADFETADADLYLYNTRGEILDFSIDTGDLEQLTVEEDGTYVVNAFAFDGATNYILAIGAPGTAAARAPARDFVPHEIILSYHGEQQQALSASEVIERRMANRMGLRKRAGAAGRDRLMAIEDQARAPQAARLGKAADKLGQIKDKTARLRWETLQTIKTLRRDPAVRYAEPNYRVRALATPNDEAYPVQYHYPLIGLPGAWDFTTGDPGVIVAVVDTGVLANHPDLSGQLVDGYDFIRNSANAGDGNGIDPNPEDPGETGTPGAGSFHGTHVLGTVAAKGNNQIGVAGAAFTARAMPLRVLGIDGGGTSYDLSQAIRYAAALSNDSGTVPDQAADIINLSLGGPGFSQAEQNLFNEVRAAGVVVVSAAGNEASTQPSYPAAYDNVISVSAVDAQRRITSYSNTGSTIDVAAPGGDNGFDLNGDGYPDGVLSTDGTLTDDGVNFVYRFLSGTSMASPHVAGVLALMKSVNPALTPRDIDVLLAEGRLTEDLGAPGRDNVYGHGLINAQLAVIAALEAAGSSPADNPRLVTSSSTLNFGGTVDALALSLRNGGTGDLVLQDVTSSESWLAIAPVEVDEAGLGDYEVTVDRSNLPAGVYDADITARSSVNSLTVRALVSVGGDGTGSDVGVIYVLLYDPEADVPVAQFDASGEDAVYEFTFSGVAAGEYELIAGSDADNDLFICDAGEACGALISLDQPIRLVVDGDVDDLDFPIEYQVLLPQLAGQQAGDGEQPRARGIPRLAAD